MKTNASKQKGLTPAVIMIVVVIAVAALLMNRGRQKTSSFGTRTPLPSRAQSFFSSFLGGKPAGMILEAKTTRTIDPKTGAGGDAITAFTPKDPEIFTALRVNKPPKGTKLEYIRYFKGKYVDHKSLDITKDGIDYVSFSWKLKAGVARLVGDYKIKLYTNGNFEKELSYSIQ